MFTPLRQRISLDHSRVLGELFHRMLTLRRISGFGEFQIGSSLLPRSPSSTDLPISSASRQTLRILPHLTQSSCRKSKRRRCFRARSEKATGTKYGWLSNGQANLQRIERHVPTSTRHSTWDLSVIRMRASPFSLDSLAASRDYFANREQGVFQLASGSNPRVGAGLLVHRRSGSQRRRMFECRGFRMRTCAQDVGQLRLTGGAEVPSDLFNAGMLRLRSTGQQGRCDHVAGASQEPSTAKLLRVREAATPLTMTT